MIRSILLTVAISVAVLSALLATRANAAILTTTFGGTNGQAGNMFDVEVLANDLLVTSLDLHLFNNFYEVSLYIRNGTFVGHENSTAGWTLIDTISVRGFGTGFPTPVDFADFDLSANSTYGFYVTDISIPQVNLRYTNGTAVGNVAASNSDLRILEWIGHGRGFEGITIGPRI